MTGPGDGKEVVWRRFLGTMNHIFRFSTSGNPTKHMPIGYLSLWVHPRSVTSGDLSWPWNSYGTMSRVAWSCIDTNLINYPIQINRTTPSWLSHDLVEILLEVVPLTASLLRDLIWTNHFFHQKSREMPHKLWKISARFSKRCGVQFRKTHGGCINPPDRARVNVSADWYAVLCIT